MRNAHYPPWMTSAGTLSHTRRTMMRLSTMEAMIWTYSEHQDAYIAVAGAYRCRVYHERAGTWTAIVLHQATATVQEDFPSAERAMLWCEHFVQQAA